MEKFSRWLLREAISSSSVDEASKLITSFLSKKLGAYFYRYPEVESFKNSDGTGYGIRYFYSNKSIRFNWKTANINSMSLSSIDLWDGTSSNPNLHLKFDTNESLVKILPAILDYIKDNAKVEPGTFYLIPDNNSSEDNTGASEVNEEFIPTTTDTLDHVLNYLEPNKLIINSDLVSSLGHDKAYAIMIRLRKLKPNLFSKTGREVSFIGTQEDLKSLKSNKIDILSQISAVKTTITKGSANEIILPSAAEKDIEERGGLEKVAYEEQLKHLSILMKLVINGSTNALFIAGRGGTGKALPIDTPVLMSDKTWKAIGDIIPGDMVCSWDGSPTEVIGVYPQGIRETSRVSFSDGRISQTDNDHLWEVNHYRWKSSKILTTKEIDSLIKKGLDARVHIPLYTDDYSDDIELPLDPWLLGFLIGDGALTNGTTCFSTKDDYIVEKIKNELKDGYEVGSKDNGCDHIIKKTTGLGTRETNFYSEVIRSLGLDVVSDKKFIPEIYKNASKKQKIDLIRGLIDSDGYVDSNGSLSFTSTSERLVDDLRDLIWSIRRQSDEKGT